MLGIPKVNSYVMKFFSFPNFIQFFQINKNSTAFLRSNLGSRTAYLCDAFVSLGQLIRLSLTIGTQLA